MKRIANFLAGLAIALALGNAQAFTAVAYSNSASRVGASMNAPSKEAAMAAAVENCKTNGGGSDCKVFKVTEERGFAAIFMTCANGCGVTAVTGGASKELARANAKRDCENYYKSSCQLVSELEERGYQEPVKMASAPTKAVAGNKPADRSGKNADPSADRTPGKIFKDCAVCPEMVNIPAGSFDMGRSGEGGSIDEMPMHQVSVPKFAMGRTEITVAQWKAFVRETGFTEDPAGCSAINSLSGADKVKGWSDPGYPQSDAHPVSCIDWDDAGKYVAWLAKKVGKPYRLPSEAEWEYAARAGATPLFPWGSDPRLACDHANVFDMTGQAADSRPGPKAFRCNDGSLYPVAVASYRPNAFGLYDMIGNLEEWTADCWHSNYAGAPADGAAWTEDNCTLRLSRGGSWYFDSDSLKRTPRSYKRNSHPYRYSGHVVSGLRVALSTDPAVLAPPRRIEFEPSPQHSVVRDPMFEERRFQCSSTRVTGDICVELYDPTRF